MINTLQLIGKVIRYNLKIIFVGRFLWFLLAALAFYILFMVISVFDNTEIDIGLVYNLNFFPALLLIFYPMVFGLQRDDDARMLEILFGIPDYRYKVWLVRLVLIFIQIFLFLILFAAIGSYLLYPVNPIELAAQLIFPVYFLGSMAFLFSTFIKNGNATAVVVILITLLLSSTTEMIEDTYWNIFLNPFDTPRDFSDLAWQTIVWKNRIFLSVGTIVFILTALLNLQNRERYV